MLKTLSVGFERTRSMAISRIVAAGTTDERSMLIAYLEFHRATLVTKCEGLTAVHLAERALPPSELSLLGLVRHMADVERNWFRRRLDGEECPYCFRTDEDVHADFREAAVGGVSEAFLVWRSECEHARSVFDRHGLEDVAPWLRNGEEISLRWIMLHMIEEYARHNGHADLLRERIDGITGI
jgi:uncharacterized damage-inducible protein DinB